LACGTPVVGFDIGGNKDMIEHRENGYLATPFEPDDLAQGIEYCLQHPDPKALRENARAKVERCFAAPVVAKQYVALYEEV